MYRVLTVAREYGSGGATIARKVAELLEWRLLDRELIDEIARAAGIDPGLAEQYDERVDSWIHRLSRHGLWHGAFEGVAAVAETDFLDAETMALRTRNVIESAYASGPCVIVGRGGQCILGGKPGVFHVYVYAPVEERLHRIRRRFPDRPARRDALEAMDAERAAYIRLNFGEKWTRQGLYHLMIDSSVGEDAAAAAIVTAMQVRASVSC